MILVGIPLALTYLHLGPLAPTIISLGGLALILLGWIIDSAISKLTPLRTDHHGTPSIDAPQHAD
jgi:hypothetical protein